MNFFYFVFFLISQIVFVNCHASLSNDIFIRTNQIGFFPDDLKTAVVLSNINLKDKPFFILDNSSNKIKFEGSVIDSPSVYGNFNFCYEIDFSKLNTTGTYKIKLADTESYPNFCWSNS